MTQIEESKRRKARLCVTFDDYQAAQKGNKSLRFYAWLRRRLQAKQAQQNELPLGEGE